MEAVGRLAGGIAHDFNNLLTAIMGYSQLILMRSHEDQALTQDVEEILKASERAAALTRQLLAFSRRQTSQPRVIDLNEILSEMDKLLQRVIGADVDICTRAGRGLDRVKVDPGQIEQVIMNLAVNARDAMPTGGRLTIETANALLERPRPTIGGDVPAGRYVTLTVSDTGTGISPDVLALIFEPFFTTKEVGQGTGLGLSTVFGIVQQSGGFIDVSSRPGQGATFRIYFPHVEIGRAEAIGSPTPREARRGSGRVLVIEDEEQVRRIAAQALAMAGYTVLEAANRDEAARICESCAQNGRSIDLLITDMVMPGMSADDLRARLDALGFRMPVLSMSGHAEGASNDQGSIEPGRPFIQKPFRVADLQRKVRDLLDQTEQRAA
jgi:CheY-like chemotaxis protein